MAHAIRKAHPNIAQQSRMESTSSGRRPCPSVRADVTI
jgi:hypothetical protein